MKSRIIQFALAAAIAALLLVASDKVYAHGDRNAVLNSCSVSPSHANPGESVRIRAKATNRNAGLREAVLYAVFSAHDLESGRKKWNQKTGEATVRKGKSRSFSASLVAGEDLEKGRYEITCGLWRVAYGAHVLQEHSGGGGSGHPLSSPTLTVVNPPPRIVATSPDERRDIETGESVTFSAEAEDRGGDLVKAEWRKNNSRIGCGKSTNPSRRLETQCTWQFHYPGRHRVEAKFIDDDGQTARYEWEVDAEEPEMEPPEIVEVEPTGSSRLAPGEQREFSATAESQAGLASVEWSIAGRKACSETFRRGRSRDKSDCLVQAPESAGEFDVEVEFEDRLDESARHSWSVVVEPPHPPVTGTIDIRVSNEDDDAHVVEFAIAGGAWRRAPDAVPPATSATVARVEVEVGARLIEIKWFDEDFGNWQRRSMDVSAEAGQITSATFTIDRNEPPPPNAPPTVTKIQPTADRITVDAGQSVLFEIRADDRDRDLRELRWYADGSDGLLAARTSPGTSGWVDSLSHSFMTAGHRRLIVVAEDSAGAMGSAAWDITVASTPPPPGNPPTLSNPRPQSERLAVEIDESIVFHIVASDLDRDLRAIRWYLNGDLVDEKTTTGLVSGWPDYFTHTFARPGESRVAVIAEDAAGLTATAWWRVSVSEPPPPETGELVVSITNGSEAELAVQYAVGDGGWTRASAPARSSAFLFRDELPAGRYLIAVRWRDGGEWETREKSAEVVEGRTTRASFFADPEPPESKIVVEVENANPVPIVVETSISGGSWVAAEAHRSSTREVRRDERAPGRYKVRLRWKFDGAGYYQPSSPMEKMVWLDADADEVVVFKIHRPPRTTSKSPPEDSLTLDQGDKLTLAVYGIAGDRDLERVWFRVEREDGREYKFYQRFKAEDDADDSWFWEQKVGKWLANSSGLNTIEIQFADDRGYLSAPVSWTVAVSANDGCGIVDDLYKTLDESELTEELRSFMLGDLVELVSDVERKAFVQGLVGGEACFLRDTPESRTPVFFITWMASGLVPVVNSVFDARDAGVLTANCLEVVKTGSKCDVGDLVIAWAAAAPVDLIAGAIGGALGAVTGGGVGAVPGAAAGGALGAKISGGIDVTQALVNYWRYARKNPQSASESLKRLDPAMPEAMSKKVASEILMNKEGLNFGDDKAQALIKDVLNGGDSPVRVADGLNRLKNGVAKHDKDFVEAVRKGEKTGAGVITELDNYGWLKIREQNMKRTNTFRFGVDGKSADVDFKVVGDPDDVVSRNIHMEAYRMEASSGWGGTLQETFFGKKDGKVSRQLKRAVDADPGSIGVMLVDLRAKDLETLPGTGDIDDRLYSLFSTALRNGEEHGDAFKAIRVVRPDGEVVTYFRRNNVVETTPKTVPWDLDWKSPDGRWWGE